MHGASLHTPYLNVKGPAPRADDRARPHRHAHRDGRRLKSSGLYEGKQIYITRCQTCHGCAGNGLGTYGGTLVVTPVNYKQEPFRAMPDDQWFWHVIGGRAGHGHAPVEGEPDRGAALEGDPATSSRLFAQPFEHDPDEGDVPPPYAT